MQSIPIQQAPERSVHACPAPALVQVLPMTFRGRKMLLSPCCCTDPAYHRRQHRRCTGELKATTGLSAGSYIVFNKTAEVNLKVAFGSETGIQVIYLFICNDSDGRARGGCSFPSPTLCWLQAGSTQLCPLQHAWLALLCTHLCTKDR